jgi:dihydroorotate dehydrogenase electron transfer subunit
MSASPRPKVRRMKLSNKAKILDKEWYSTDIFGLKVSLPGINPLPGQFFQIQAGKGLDPFLNRPISVAQYERGVVHFIIQVVGHGTSMLSAKEPGEELTLFGPFGTGVKPMRKKSLIIAGGIGVAPLLFVAQYLAKKKVSFTFLYGARNKQDLILTKKIRSISNQCSFVAERGFKRQRTVLQELAARSIRGFACAYACGPRAMLIALQRMRLPIPVYAFCEDFLGCGCGLCLGCAIRYQGEYKRICEDGPVFELHGIRFNG